MPEKTSTPTTKAQWTQARQLIEWARDNECQEIRVGEIEVKFAPRTRVSGLELLQQAEQAEQDTADGNNIMYYSS